MSTKQNVPVIECAHNGPFVVAESPVLRNARGDAVPTQGTVYLCRCGGSNDKPFCDGTHKKIGFSGEKAAERTQDRRKDYLGQHITIHDNRGLCSHAAHCVANLPQVFRRDAQPWIAPDGAEVDLIIDTIKKCPSGALSYSIADIEHRDQDRVPEIRVVKGGPYEITGGIELKDVSWGEGASQEHYTLCRCGASKNKPFCDGSHADIGFRE